MLAEAIEIGTRPGLFTPARRYAPAAAKELAGLFEQQEFADTALIVLDWSNQLSSMPDEVSRPMMHVKVIKVLPEYQTGNRLSVDIRLDVDDVFGNDEVTASTLVDLVQEMKMKVAEQVAFRRNQ